MSPNHNDRSQLVAFPFEKVCKFESRVIAAKFSEKGVSLSVKFSALYKTNRRLKNVSAATGSSELLSKLHISLTRDTYPPRH